MSSMKSELFSYCFNNEFLKVLKEYVDGLVGFSVKQFINALRPLPPTPPASFCLPLHP